MRSEREVREMLKKVEKHIKYYEVATRIELIYWLWVKKTLEWVLGEREEI